MAPSVAITLLADRGFGDQKLYQLLTLLGWDYVIRFRGGILVENASGEVRPANEWVLPGGRALLIRGAKVTADKASVPGVVLVHARNMKGNRCVRRRTPRGGRGGAGWAVWNGVVQPVALCSFAGSGGCTVTGPRGSFISSARRRARVAAQYFGASSR